LPRRRDKRLPALVLAALGMLVLAALLAASGDGEVTATHDATIKFDSEIFPRVLPRHGHAPVGIRIDGHVKAHKGKEVALTTLELAIHRAADISPLGLPICDIAAIEPSSTAQALAACPGSQIGHGDVRALLRFPEAKEIHFVGQVVVFNGRLEDGRRAILLHVFNPLLRTSFVFPLTISHQPGRFHTVLKAHVRLDRWSSITDFNIVLDRSYRYRGHRRSFLSAGCPAPKGFSIGISPFVVATLGFADDSKAKIPVVGSCKVTR
jgi:hypothetical protein